MATKHGIKEVPNGINFDDVECFGPVVNRDTEFTGCRMADMGCFLQEAKGEGGKTIDSNKYYHAAVVQHKGTWYLYCEWGRTQNGAASRPNFQFTECTSEDEALKQFVSQCKKKNTSRGEWSKVGSREIFVPKKDSKGKMKDLYTIRVLASRAVGLLNAKNICNADAIGEVEDTAKTKKKTKKKSKPKIDAKTRKLFQDLIGGAVSYTKSSMVGGTVPAQSAIDDARDLLQDALKRVKKVGGKVINQVKDNDLKQLTYSLYGMIPKVKHQGSAEEDWILSKDNIFNWQQDLDAFETALKSADLEEETSSGDEVMDGIPADVKWIDPKSDLGLWLDGWWKSASRNRHSHVRNFKIHNMWQIERNGDFKAFEKSQRRIAEEIPKNWNKERPPHQDSKRIDLEKDQRKLFKDSNTGLVFHGTRSVNVTGIIRESFRFPKELVGVSTNGANFGQGTYFADDFKKSCGYCSSPNAYYCGDGGVDGRQSFMFACDVAFGHPHVALSSGAFTKPPGKHHSVFAKATSRTYLANNEWIVYSKGRAVLKYLAEISWG
jgi:hypothetical protein